MEVPLPTPEAPRDSSPRLAANLAIGSCHAGTLAACRAAFALVAIYLGAAAWSTGLIMALFGVLPALATVPLGRWMDRLGRFPVMALSLGAAIAGLFQAALLLNLSSLLIAAPLIGMASVVTHVGVARVLGAVDDLAIRARNLGYLALCYSTSHFAGPLLAGAVLDGAGPRVVFLVIAALPVFAIVLLLQERSRGSDSGEGVGSEVQDASFMQLLRIVELRRWLIVNGAFAAALTLFPFVASLKAAELALSASQAGWLIAAAALGSVVIRASLPVLVRRMGQEVILAGSFIATAAAYGGVPMLSDFDLLVGLSFFLGMAFGVGMPISTTLIYSAAPEGRVSETLCLGMSISMLLQSLAPLLLGAVASAFGLHAMAATIAVLLAVAAVYARPPRSRIAA